MAVSALNSAHKSVTQESLIEHLQTCFPGMSSSDISIGWLLMYAYNYIFTVTSPKKRGTFDKRLIMQGKICGWILNLSLR